MKMFQAAVMALWLSCALTAGARESVPVINHENVVVTTRTGAAPSAEAVREAIAAAIRAKEWTMTESGTPGTITASLVVRNKHTITVDISYTATMYSIRYRSSVNMNYEANRSTISRISGGGALPVPVIQGPVIHPNYNVWVGQLMAAINGELARI